MDTVHRASRFRRARREHGLVDLVAVHAPASEEGQERGVQVDHRNSGQSHEEDRRKDVIEAGQHHELGADARNRHGHRRVRGGAVGIGAQREDGAGHAGECGPLQRGNASMVGDDDRHTRVELA